MRLLLTIVMLCGCGGEGPSGAETDGDDSTGSGSTGEAATTGAISPTPGSTTSSTGLTAATCPADASTGGMGTSGSTTAAADGSSTTSIGDSSSSSTTSAGSSFPGDYDGVWEGNCTGIPASGTLEFAVDEDEVVTGTFAGSDMGALDGTVDAMGTLTLVGAGMLLGDCEFEGPIGSAGDVIGNWTCPIGCVGTWTASAV